MEKIRPLGPSAILIAILLLALALRLAPWGQNRFLEDEALYAYWGLQIATGADPMLDEEPVDKPPLHPYTLALGFMSFASTPQAGWTGLGSPEPEAWRETAARLPSLFASLASIALAGRESSQRFCCGALAWLGNHLVAWGQGLENRYSNVPSSPAPQSANHLSA